MMRKAILSALVVFALVTLSSSALAASWNIDASTKTINDHFEGSIKTGVFQYSLDNTGVDCWNNYEITKVGKTATWDKGFIFSSTDYKCPGVSSASKYGKATSVNMVQTNKNGDSGYFRENFNANYAQLQKSGDYFGYGYGTELMATGTYDMFSGLQDAKSTSHGGFLYQMSGVGSGKIRYGNAIFSASPNWAPDKHGSVMLNKWEYNDASATGKGIFEEHLNGHDFLENFKYSLPGGGNIDSFVTFNDGMDATKLWMTGN